MTRKQVHVQLSEQLVALLDERAAKTGCSRSHLIREAVEQYLHDEIEAAIDAAIVEGYTRFPENDDPWVEIGARRMITSEPW